jgi:hypothetical protein
VIRKLGLGLAGLMLTAALGIELAPANAYAAKVDCAKVMAEANAGKKPKVIAKDLGISASSVYRCKKKMAAASKTSSMKSTAPAPAASPAK